MLARENSVKFQIFLFNPGLSKTAQKLTFVTEISTNHNEKSFCTIEKVLLSATKPNDYKKNFPATFIKGLDWFFVLIFRTLEQTFHFCISHTQYCKLKHVFCSVYLTCHITSLFGDCFLF